MLICRFRTGDRVAHGIVDGDIGVGGSGWPF